MPPDVIVRQATLEDLPGIVAIYNDAVENTTATFDTQIKPPAEHEPWFHQHDQRYAILVLQAAGQSEILAWGSLSRWSDRCGYDATAEVSYYVASDHRGQGLGRKLLAGLVDHARANHMHTLIARMAGENIASIKLAAGLGFEDVGTLREVGRKFGRRLDVHISQLML